MTRINLSILRKDLTIALPIVLIVAVFGLAVFALIAFAIHDNIATMSCQAMHGQTWDSGAHCVLGHPKVVNTR